METQFASTINKKYMPGAIKFLKSLKLHNPHYNYLYNFFIIDNSLDKDDKTSISSIYRNVKFIDILSDDYKYNSLSNKWRDWGYNCFNRFDIFLLECDKVIFFDLDMLCFNNLDYLISIDCDFGAVQAPEEQRLDHPNEKYFDGGLMVISKKFLNKETKQSLIEISKQKYWTSDEPVLNSFFNNITWLPKKYNVLTSEYSKAKDISILQYVGHKKPWNSKNLTENFDKFIFSTQGGINVIKLQYLYNSII